METEKKLLEVGDVVVRQSRGTTGVSTYKIQRTTQTLAISGGYRFKREVKSGYVFVHPYKAFSPYTFQLPTPSLQLQLQTQELRRELKSWFNEEDNHPTLPQLLSIKKTLTLPDEDLAIWIKVEDLDKDNLPLGDFLGFEDGGDIVVGRLYKITNVDSDSKKTYDIALEYDEGDNAIYPTQVIPIMSLLHLPTKPSTK